LLSESSFCQSSGVGSGTGTGSGAGRVPFSFMSVQPGAGAVASGGVHIAGEGKDVLESYAQPALLQPKQNKQLGVAFQQLYGDIKTFSAQYVFQLPSSSLTWSVGAHGVRYGSLLQTDVAGNELGVFKPGEQILQVGVGGKYLEKWQYGFNLKWATLQYASFRGGALAADWGLMYVDTSSGWQFALLAQNMGTAYRSPAGGVDEVPFDLRLGFSKRLKNAPLVLGLTAWQLHRGILRYEDPLFEEETGIAPPSNGFLAKMMRHLSANVKIYPIEELELQVGYNHLRREELRLPNNANGLTGYSLGAAMLLPSFQFRGAMGWYQAGRPFFLIGIQASLQDKLFNW